MNEQLSIFDLTMPYISVDKPIRLIELFSGVGSQAMALRDLGADFEHYRSVEFDEHAVRSYNAIHGTNFPVTDIRDVHGEDLGIVDKDTFTYLLTYSFPCQDLSAAGSANPRHRSGSEECTKRLSGGLGSYKVLGVKRT